MAIPEHIAFLRLEDFLDITAEAVIVISSAQHILLFNRAAEEIFGYKAAEILGQPLDLLIPARFMEDHKRHVHAFASASEISRLMADRMEISGRRKAGNEFPIEASIAKIVRGGEMFLAVFLHDLTEKKKIEQDLIKMYQLLEKRVEERTQELSALLEVSRSVASSIDLRPLLALILSQLKTVVDYTGAAIAILDGDEFIILDYEGPAPCENLVNLHIPATSAGIYQEVILRRQPMLIGDLWGKDAQVRQAGMPSENFMEDNLQYAHSWLGIPLISEGKLMGILHLDYAEPDHFNESHARLASAFAEQAAIAIDKSNLYEQAQALAALEERQKLARELHDSVSQALYGIALGARTARTLLDRDPAKAAEPLEYCLSLAEAGLAEMRALIFELRPESLQLEGLVAALSKQAAALQARHSIEVKTTLCDEPEVPMTEKEAFYRIALEALQNVVKHAHASHVELALRRTDEKLVLELRDDGIGFNPSATYPGHLGLSSMRERIEQVGGSLQIESTIGKGTYLRVQAPA